MSEILTRLNELANNPTELDEEIARLEAQRDDLGDTITALKRFKAQLARDFGPPKPARRKPAARRGRQPAKRKLRVSDRRLLEVADAVLAAGDTFTQTEIARNLGINSGPVSTAFGTLAELQFVGRVGTRPGKYQRATEWRVFDADALDTLRAKVAHETAQGNGQPA